MSTSTNETSYSYLHARIRVAAQAAQAKRDSEAVEAVAEAIAPAGLVVDDCLWYMLVPLQRREGSWGTEERPVDLEDFKHFGGRLTFVGRLRERPSVEIRVVLEKANGPISAEAHVSPERLLDAIERGN